MAHKRYTLDMTLYGYIRTSRKPVDDVPGNHPESQLLAILNAGVDEEHVYRDVGVSGTTATASRQGWSLRLSGKSLGVSHVTVSRYPEQTHMGESTPVAPA